MNFATKQATYDFAKKFSNYKDFYAEFDDLLFSKLGIGTFNGEPYKEENYVFHYIEAVKEAVKNGINHIDSASNYRYGESEKEIGIALKELFENNEAKREELIITSKAGFIQLEYPFPENPYKWIEQNILDNNLAKKSDIDLDQHCITPDFLEWSCRRSLKNMNIESFDIFYLHNPEMQLQRLGRNGFLAEVEKIFTRFEKLADEGLFKSYGVATWNGFINPYGSTEHINLEDLVKIAVKVGGENHRFKYIQTPFNIAKSDIYLKQTQTVNNEMTTLLQSAHRLNIGVITSSSLLQMNLFKRAFKPEIGFILDEKMKLNSDIQLALQYVRSTPTLISSLFASKVPVHIRENLQITELNAVKKSRYDLLYRLNEVKKAMS
jgi:aryl-alcohol dehydrogenase-like predicted oxidoreductase